MRPLRAQISRANFSTRRPLSNRSDCSRTNACVAGLSAMSSAAISLHVKPGYTMGHATPRGWDGPGAGSERSVRAVVPWDKRIEPFLDRYPALRAIGSTPLVPVPLFRDELPGVEVFAKMEGLNPGGSLKDRPVLHMLLAALAEGDPQRYFFCDQYSNENNWRAHYDTTAAEILEQTGGRLTHVIAGVGTGGTITGLGRRLKEHDSRIHVVCVLPELFPGIEGLKPLGAPEDIVPAILDGAVIDERVPVTSDEGYRMCARLARAGFFVGQSSGAYMVGVERVARRERAGRFVTLFNDLGERYFSTRLWD